MAELTEARKAALLAYCRIDELGPGEDALIEAIYASIVGYMADAGVAEPPEGTDRRARYDLCVDAMVLDSWDHRGTQTGGQALADNPEFRRRLNQLKFSEPEPVSESDT